ncbi:ATP-binding protein [Altererythrobacter sp. TH136]|uniref:hybrid sensor histidine kinase/response regulator n=1 Tax=Altererythrobacter sp. TH136 TaxID=2067415 RepID=UPI00116592C2|nr:ATP-binding protein [Altererythrobacter sp. TH136]QDM41178.1 response regulator [Altererythrobacter sp. TH136]
MNRTLSERAIVLAPLGRDAAVATAVLAEAGLDAAAVADVPGFVAALREGAGFAIVTEDALRGSDLRAVAEFLAEQAEWSDFPFIVLTARGGGIERNPAASRLLEMLGNVTFLERPFHPTSLVSLARSARRARLRQYEARRRLEEIREGQERMSLALSAGRLGSWSFHLATGDLTTSPEGKAHYGRAPDEPLTLEDLRDAIHPDDLPRWEQAVAGSVESGRDLDIEYRCIWPDRSLHRVKINGRIERDAADVAVRIVGVSQDVTSARATEHRRAALLALGDGLRNKLEPTEMTFLAAEILSTTLGVSRAGYGIIDPAAETITIERDWNQPGTRSIAGVLQFRDYGSYIEELKRGETVVVADARLDPRTADTASELEAIHARSFINMPLIDHNNFVALLFLNHEHVREWTPAELAFVRDVADRTHAAVERRVAEQALASLAENLEQQVDERTRESEAAQEQLRQSQKMEAVGQLTGGLAHDFNNLLMGVSGALDLIGRRAKQERFAEIPKYLEMAEGGIARAAGLTHRLLAFSRRQTLDPKPTDLKSVVANLADFLQRSVGPSISVTVQHQMTLWPTLIDQNQFENALLNLCINARDAMPDGGEIVIETENRTVDQTGSAADAPEPGDYVRITVSDTGTGMAADIIERAFDPFYTTKPLGEGTGLGLSMVYGFVRQSGGHVRIESQVGEGTAVHLYFPRSEHREAIATAPSRQERRDQPNRGETVMIVDDEVLIRTLVAESLEELGYRTIQASDGVQALGMIGDASGIDLLITDVGLPNGLNGRQLADAARTRRPDLNVLFITGYAENTVFGDAPLDGGMHLLTKPFELGELARRVSELTRAQT